MHQAEQERPTAQWPLQEATSKVEEIISNAEAAAGNILDGAEVEAERYIREVCQDSEREALEHARALSELSDNLIAQAEALSRQSRLILEQLNALGEGGNGATGASDDRGDSAEPPRWDDRPEPAERSRWGEAPADRRARRDSVEREEEPYGPAWGQPGQVRPIAADPPLDVAEGPGPELAEEQLPYDEPSTDFAAEPQPDFDEAPPAEVTDGPAPGWREGPRPVEPEDVQPAEAPSAPFEPEVGRREESINERYSPGARLLATQMAVAGSDRAEIRDRLVNDFEIRDPDPLLEAIIGRG